MLLFDPPRPKVLFIQKADTEGYPWRNQVALPGGHRDPEDASALHAAFRELREELSIPPEQVAAIGSLGHFQTKRGKDIEVFIGRWDESGPLRHDTHEIARVLTIPLKTLVQTHQAQGFHGRIPDTRQLRYPFDDLVIWGATARIVHYFIELTYPAFPPGHWKTAG